MCVNEVVFAVCLLLSLTSSMVYSAIPQQEYRSRPFDISTRNRSIDDISIRKPSRKQRIFHEGIRNHNINHDTIQEPSRTQSIFHQGISNRSMNEDITREVSRKERLFQDGISNHNINYDKIRKPPRKQSVFHEGTWKRSTSNEDISKLLESVTGVILMPNEVLREYHGIEPVKNAIRNSNRRTLSRKAAARMLNDKKRTRSKITGCTRTISMSERALCDNIYSIENKNRRSLSARLRKYNDRKVRNNKIYRKHIPRSYRQHWKPVKTRNSNKNKARFANGNNEYNRFSSKLDNMHEANRNLLQKSKMKKRKPNSRHNNFLNNQHQKEIATKNYETNEARKRKKNDRLRKKWLNYNKNRSPSKNLHKNKKHYKEISNDIESNMLPSFKAPIPEPNSHNKEIHSNKEQDSIENIIWDILDKNSKHLEITSKLGRMLHKWLDELRPLEKIAQFKKDFRKNHLNRENVEDRVCYCSSSRLSNALAFSLGVVFTIVFYILSSAYLLGGVSLLTSGRAVIGRNRDESDPYYDSASQRSDRVQKMLKLFRKQWQRTERTDKSKPGYRENLTSTPERGYGRVKRSILQTRLTKGGNVMNKFIRLKNLQRLGRLPSNEVETAFGPIIKDEEVSLQKLTEHLQLRMGATLGPPLLHSVKGIHVSVPSTTRSSLARKPNSRKRVKPDKLLKKLLHLTSDTGDDTRITEVSAFRDEPPNQTSRHTDPPHCTCPDMVGPLRTAVGYIPLAAAIGFTASVSTRAAISSITAAATAASTTSTVTASVSVTGSGTVTSTDTNTPTLTNSATDTVDVTALTVSSDTTVNTVANDQTATLTNTNTAVGR